MGRVRDRLEQKKNKPRASTTGRGRKARVDQTNWRVKLRQSRIKFDDDQKKIYLEDLAKHGMKARAAKTAGVSRATVLNHIENDEEFSERYDDALQEYRDGFVDHAVHDLAREGVLVERFDKDGKLVMTKREYPIPIIQMELKRIEPAYRDKQTIDLNHGGGVMVAPAGISPEDWIKREEEENKKRQKPGSEKGPEAP